MFNYKNILLYIISFLYFFALFQHILHYKHDKLDIVVLEIDLTKTHLKNQFYYDPNIKESVFTYSTINPEFVDIYTIFEL